MSAPGLSSETREEMLTRWEREGWLVPDCPGCAVFYRADGHPSSVHVPGHKASNGCKSGKRPHCCCLACW